MGEKTMRGVVAVLFLVLLSACSTGSLRRKEKKSLGGGEENISKNIPVREEESSQEIEVDEEVNSESSEPVQRWGIWIRGVGVDAFAGLGFLQQFSEMIGSPSRVAGTGMGCWVASSWATKNNGNYAEWQAFKFEDWSAFDSSLLGRVTGVDMKERFLAYLLKIRSSRKDSVYEIPLECPLYEKRRRSLNLAQDINLDERMYYQLDIDLLRLKGFGVSAYESGAKFRSNGDEILEALSSGEDKPEVFAWIILESSANHRLWGSKMEVDHGVTRGGIRWVRLPVGQGLGISAEQLKDFGLRRKWLLQGRRDAKRYLNNAEIKDFLQR